MFYIKHGIFITRFYTQIVKFTIIVYSKSFYHMKQYILSWIILGFFLTGCKTQHQHHHHSSDHKAAVVDAKAKERIDSLFKKLVADRNVGGISALIYEKDKEVYFNAFGAQNEEKKIPMSRQTIVQIWSMTKPLTGTALMTLYEKGLFNLDDPLSKYFQDFRDMKVFCGNGCQWATHF